MATALSLTWPPTLNYQREDGIELRLLDSVKGTSSPRLGDQDERDEVDPTSKSLLDKTLLDTDDAFLIDLRSIVVVWVGQGATNQERLGVLAFTEEYLDTCEDDHLSKFTPVVKLDEGDAWPRSMRRAFNPKGSAGISLKAVATTVSAAAAVTSAKVDVVVNMTATTEEEEDTKPAAAATSAAAEPPPQAPRMSSKEATPEAAAAAVVAIEAPAAAVAMSAAEEAPLKKKKKKKSVVQRGCAAADGGDGGNGRVPAASAAVEEQEEEQEDEQAPPSASAVTLGNDTHYKK